MRGFRGLAARVVGWKECRGGSNWGGESRLVGPKLGKREGRVNEAE